MSCKVPNPGTFLYNEDMLADYHVHSAFSDDSEYDMEEVVIDAIDKGIDELCFTDHVDYGIKLDHGEPGTTARKNPDGTPLRNVDYPSYFARIAYLQDKYKDQITIRKGLEFGLQMCQLSRYQKLYDSYPMDFVINSNHQVNDIEIFLPEFFAGKSQKEYNRVYYQEILDVVKVYKDYSVLGHLDAFNRYDPKGNCPLEDFVDIVYEIFKIIIADGKGIELNTSNVRYGVKDLTPSRDILRIYHELGGQIITIGSDSHAREHLGFNIEAGREELKKIGFRQFCTFENMQPIFHEL